MDSKTSKQLALPLGSLILVSGATGYIASHIIKEALAFGYKVRGTARSQSKAEQTEKLFNDSNYEAAVVAHMAEDGAFDEAVKGVDAIIHTASVMSFSPNPNEVIPDVVAGATSVLKSALKEPKVKRFVYTSSSTAAATPQPGKKFKMDKSTWNDAAVEQAWRPPPYNADRAFTVYAASKTEGERAVWKFGKEQQPNFVINCVLPNANMGRILASEGATGGWAPSVLKGEVPAHVPPQWMIDVQDDARIHLAAAVDASLTDERIYAFDSPFNWNDVIDAVQKARPDAKLPAHIKDEERDLSEPDNGLGAELLRRWCGTQGYKGLEQSVKENLEGL